MQTKIKEEKVINGKTLRLYQLKNRNNTTIEICNYGARITRIIFNDIFSNPVDIVCGFNNVEDFITKDNPYFNAVIGRVCNRIENAKFKLNKVEYNLCANNGKNSLHGGNEGFDKKYWTSEIENGRLKMSYISKDGEENYPGNLKIAVYYFLSEQDELEIEYEYSSDQDTIVNLTNHAYFNLNGDFSIDVTNHILKINSSKFSAVDESLIPIQSKSVEGTPFDFRNYKQIGKDINNDDIQLKYGNGYDHNFILDNKNYDECVCQIFSYFSNKNGSFY